MTEAAGKKRCILVLLDGLGDRSYAELGHRTPLAAAETPNLDALASLGASGLLHAESPGVALPSENAHFALFGYPKEEFPGRGCLEALGAGIPLRWDEVAVLAHFVSVCRQDDTLVLVRDRPRTDPDEARAFAGLISSFAAGDIEVRFQPTGRLGGIVLLRGEVARSVTDSDPLREETPLQEVMPLAPAVGDRAARETARALNSYLAWCYETLRRHPANRLRRDRGEAPINGLVTQRAGQLRRVDSFSSRWGLAGLTVASGLVYQGLGRFLGLDVKQVADSDDPGLDLAERLELALDAAGRYDFIHVHTKAPDAAAHTKDPRRKAAVIEALDRGMKVVLDRLDGRTIFVVTADHSTPSAGPMIHSGEPVPLMMIGPGIRRDLVQRFDEIHCPAGALGFMRGADLMPVVLNCLDRAKLRGLMDTPEDQPYWPGRRAPFRL